jgi:prepilin-type N-terminal cleavage/methylation domain-containing protein
MRQQRVRSERCPGGDGFTLVEILAVLAIVGILVAIVIVSLSGLT